MNLNLCDFLKMYYKLRSFLNTMGDPILSSLDKRYLDNLEVPVNALNIYEVNKVNSYKIPVRNVFQLSNTLSNNRCVGLRIIVLDTDKHIIDHTNKIASKDFATTPGTMTTTAILVGADVINLNFKPEQKDDYCVFVMICIEGIVDLIQNEMNKILKNIPCDPHEILFVSIMSRILGKMILDPTDEKFKDMLDVCTKGKYDDIAVPAMKNIYQILKLYSFGNYAATTNGMHTKLAEEFEELFEKVDIR